MNASASTALRPLVAGEQADLQVVAVFPSAVYLAARRTGRVEMVLVAADGIAHPNGVVVDTVAGRRPFAGVRDLDDASCGGHRVNGPWGAIAVGRWWSPRPVLPPAPPSSVAAAGRAAAAEVAVLSPPLSRTESQTFDALVDAVSSDHDGDARAAVDRLLGLGGGLTPTGDDLLAGFVAAVRSVESRIADAGSPPLLPSVAAVADRIETRSDRATTAISAALLRCAVRGELCTPASAFLRTLLTGAAPGTALRALLEVGGTSGRDLALGLLAGLSCLTDAALTQRFPAPPQRFPVPPEHRPNHLLSRRT